MKWALRTPKCPDSCHIYHNIQETNYSGSTEEAVLWEVSICLDLFLWRLLQFRECYQCFGQDTVVAIVGEPQWLALIPRAAVQTTSALVFPSVCSVAHCCGTAEILQLPGFPENPEFLVILIHKVNQENCNYGALEIADSCAELSTEGAFPTSGFSV